MTKITQFNNPNEEYQKLEKAFKEEKSIGYNEKENTFVVLKKGEKIPGVTTNLEVITEKIQSLLPALAYSKKQKLLKAVQEKQKLLKNRVSGWRSFFISQENIEKNKIAAKKLDTLANAILTESKKSLPKKDP